MTLDHAIAFFVFAVVAAVTPGPSNIIVTAAGARAGIIGGMPCLLGVVLGMGVMMALVALGLGSAIAETPEIARIMRWAGAAFLLWLAWKIATARSGPEDTDREPVGFFAAAAFQWINPKSWLVSLSAAATYLTPDPAQIVAQALLFGALFMAAAAPSCFLWLAFGAAMRRLLRTERVRRIFNVAMGLLLAASVVPFVAG